MKEISDLQELIVINGAFNEYDPNINDNLEKLKRKTKQLKDEMQTYVDQLYFYSHLSEGIPLENLLIEYLENSIAYVEAVASLRILRRKKGDFLRKHQILAPLGATLKQIEREIEIDKKVYMEFCLLKEKKRIG
jgi:hypothetical protein